MAHNRGCTSKQHRRHVLSDTFPIHESVCHQRTIRCLAAVLQQLVQGTWRHKLATEIKIKLEFNCITSGESVPVVGR